MEFRILGSIEVVENGSGPIALGGPKQRAVLAHLLLRANHLVPTDVLIDEVWGEEPPETVRNALQSYASHLRKALGAERVEGSRAGYILRAETSELDAARFQSLLRDARRLLPIDAKAAVGAFDHALDLWRGPAFGDLATEASLRSEAARLDDLRLAALEERIDAQLTVGELGEVIGELESLTARHPLRERFWEQLMLALYRTGRQGEALGSLPAGPRDPRRRARDRSLARAPQSCTNGSSPRAPTWIPVENRCAATDCSNAWARTPSAWSTGRRSRTWAGRSRSGSCTNIGRTIRRSSAASNPTRRPSQRWSTPTSRRSTTTGGSRVGHTS